jgi:hypothetical protein
VLYKNLYERPVARPLARLRKRRRDQPHTVITGNASS